MAASAVSVSSWLSDRLDEGGRQGLRSFHVYVSDYVLLGYPGDYQSLSV